MEASQSYQLKPVKSLEQVEGTLNAQRLAWMNLRDRVERTHERDAELIGRRNAAMEVMCEAGGLLDQFVVLNSLENGDERIA